MTNKVFYALLKEYIKVFDKPPTIREMSMITNISIAGVFYHIDKLETLGKIKRDDKKSNRKIILLEDKND